MATMQAISVNRSRIVADLAALGLRPGDRLLVHASLSSLGVVEGGAHTVIEALLDVLGPAGTLVMPSFQKGSEHVLTRQGVVFDVRTSPSEMGAISEAFRQRPGVCRSLSPTHCLAACGPDAASLLQGHETCPVSAGRGSPFERLVQCGGRILLLGVTHGSDTTLHYVENTGGAPTVCRECFQPVVIAGDGRQIVVPTYPHMPGLRRRYERVEALLLAAGAQTNGPVGQATARLVEAGHLDALVREELRRDPLYLIEVFTP
jgi:aminoglycoside 3-N-acetyltransferase